MDKVILLFQWVKYMSIQGYIFIARDELGGIFIIRRSNRNIYFFVFIRFSESFLNEL